MLSATTRIEMSEMGDEVMIDEMSEHPSDFQPKLK